MFPTPTTAKMVFFRYRYDYKHNMCVDMLREGYHKSFCELFALIKQQNDERIAAGPESSLWSQIQLENEPEKLETLKHYLTQAEVSSRKGEQSKSFSFSLTPILKHKTTRSVSRLHQTRQKAVAHFCWVCFFMARNLVFADDFVQVYKCQFSLAKYFQQTGDKWLADHFYASSLATASSVDADGGRTAAEGHCNMAAALEERGWFRRR